jgi:type I restriction enzyme S subunit
VNDWVETTIGDVAAVFDGPHATPAKVSEGPVFLGISCLSGGRLDLTATDHLSETDFKRWTRRVEPTAGDVVFSYETRLGEAALIPRGLRCCLGRRMALIRPDRGKIDSRFLLYYYLSPEFQELIRSRTVTGSTVDRILLEEFPTFPIRVPDLATQREVASLLGALDDKVELNSRMNQTLESVARAIFRSWFVDFDPVVAKAAGRQPFGMPADVAALFPGRFIDAEVGPMPAAWESCKWGDISTLEYGKSLRSHGDAAGAVRVYGTNGPIGWHTEALCPTAGIVLGRKGAYRGVHYSPTPFFVIDTAFYLKPKREFEILWAYYELLNLDINGMDSGSAIPSTSRDEFYQVPVLFPPPPVHVAFGKIVGHMFKQMEANQEQSRTLGALRDTLLPKLMSGELRVRDAEKLVGTRV